MCVDDFGSVEIFRDGGVEGAAFCGVEGVLVLSSGVDPFDHVDFTTLRPIGTDRPPSRPYAATGWHCEDVCDEEPAIVGLFGADSNRIAVTADRYVGRTVDSQDSGTVVLDIGETS